MTRRDSGGGGNAEPFGTHQLERKARERQPFLGRLRARRAVGPFDRSHQRRSPLATAQKAGQKQARPPESADESRRRLERGGRAPDGNLAAD